jgi:TonB family protein
MFTLRNCVTGRDLRKCVEARAIGSNLALRARGEVGMTLSGLRDFTATTIATVLVLLLMCGGAAAQDGYRIVVNPSNPVSSLSKNQVSKLYLEKTAWDNGAPASPVDLLPASPVRDGFSREVLGLPVPQVLDRLREASKGGTPPPALATDREVLAYVRLKPGAIGYVSLAADITGVKVIAVGGKTEHASGGAASVTPLPVGGRIAMPQRTVHAQPVYPALAKLGKVQGTVEVSVVIDARGHVEQAQIVRSIPQLDAAAIDAVRKWKYTPTVVNGVAVPVTMVVHVTFAL